MSKNMIVHIKNINLHLMYLIRLGNMEYRPVH